MSILEERIREKYSQLTPQERKLAEFILENPNDLAIFNSAELAKLCNVSKATVSRMFKRLGFASFKEGKKESRRQRQLGVPVMEGNPGEWTYTPHFEREINNLKILQESLSESHIEVIVEAIATSRNVKVLGFRNSYPLALHMRQQLIQVRDFVDLAPLPGQTLSEEIESLSSNDMVIFFAFRRRPRIFEDALRYILQQQIPVLLIADPSLRKWSDKVNWWLECPLESISGFDSYSAAMSLTTLLCNTLLHKKGMDGQERILSLSDHYRQLNELDLG